uniref:Uncharacterized protein n=1 Tax=Anguilla anguilla TaxID=7936 RepID=A0A0E9X720_ANGAN
MKQSQNLIFHRNHFSFFFASSVSQGRMQSRDILSDKHTRSFFVCFVGTYHRSIDIIWSLQLLQSKMATQAKKCYFFLIYVPLFWSMKLHSELNISHLKVYVSKIIIRSKH